MWCESVTPSEGCLAYVQYIPMRNTRWPNGLSRGQSGIYPAVTPPRLWKQLGLMHSCRIYKVLIGLPLEPRYGENLRPSSIVQDGFNTLQVSLRSHSLRADWWNRSILKHHRSFPPSRWLKVSTIEKRRRPELHLLL